MEGTSDDPSITTQPERPKQGKFSEAETDFLKSNLPAYEALCHQLEGKGTRPQSIRGPKKVWVLSEIYPKFVREFSSDQDGGPQLSSLKEVSQILWYSIVAEMLVENDPMVYKSLTRSKA